MKNRNIAKKIIWPAIIFCSAIVICVSLYFFGVLDSQKFSSGISFIMQNSRTGLINSPGAELAFNDKKEDVQKYASNALPVKGREIGSNNNNPRILFDISSEPIFKNRSTTDIILLLSLPIVIILVVMYFIYRIYRKRKLQKIKKITKQY